MLKRWIGMGVLCAFVAGCQSTPPKSTDTAPAVPPDPMGAVDAEAPPKPIVRTPPKPTTHAPAIPGTLTPDRAAEKPAAVEQPKQQERNQIMILMKTSKGDIKLELDREKAPKTVDNFLGYVEAGHYAGTIFHRVMDGFMIQGGGFDADMNQKPAPRTVENEASNGLKNVEGSIAMARTPDPHSASAQFFINVADNGFLNYPGQDGWGYCVFGKVIEGMDVVNQIKSVPTTTVAPHQNVPVEPIMIESVSVVEE